MTKPLPKISIIVPVFNGELTIKNALASLVNQDYPKDLMEIIVVDNNSTDKSASIIKQFPVQYVVEKESQSAAAARNKGSTLANGEILVFFDADGIVKNDFLTNLIKGSDDPTIGGFGGINTYQIKDDTIAFKMQEGEWLSVLNYFPLSDNKIFYQVGGNAAIRKNAFEQLGGFDTSMRSSEDFDLFYRLQTKLPLKIIINTNAVIYNKTRSWRSLLKREYWIGFGDAMFCQKYKIANKNILVLFVKLLKITFVGIFIVFLNLLNFKPWKDKKKKVSTILFDKTMQWTNFLGRLYFYSHIYPLKKNAANQMVNKSYNLALLSSGLGHIKRGIETWTEDLGKALYEKQINVSVYKGGGKKDFPYETVIGCFQRDKPITKWIIKNRSGFLWRFGFSSVYTFEQLTFCLNLLPELIFKQFDIIHTQDPQVANYMQKLNRCGLIKSKVILAHGTEEPFEYLAKFDYIQHLAPYHEEEMKSKGIQIKQNFSIGNFVNTDYFKPNIPTNLRIELNIPPDAFVIISVAAIKKFHKRIDYLINEVSLLNNPNIYLIVAGATEAESEEVIALGNTKLKDHVRFLKNFPRTRIQEVFSIANIFVLCSLKEMMPIALLEGLSSGLPAVVHQYPVLKWMIGDGGDAIDLSREGGLKETVEHYYNDKNYLKLKQQKAREHILNCFSKPIILNQIISMYEKVLK